MLDAEIGWIVSHAFYVALAIYAIREIWWQITAPKKEKQAELEEKEAKQRSYTRCFCEYFGPYGGPNGNYDGYLCETCKRHKEQGLTIDDGAFIKYCSMRLDQYPWSKPVKVEYESAGERKSSGYSAQRLGLYSAYLDLCIRFNRTSITKEEFERQLDELFDTFIRFHEAEYAKWQQKIEEEKRRPRRTTAADIMARKTSMRN